MKHSDPEQKMSSMEWKTLSSPPKKAQVTPKVVLLCFCVCEGMIMTDNLENGQTIVGDNCSGLPILLRSEFVSKRRGKRSNSVLLLMAVQTANGAALESFHPAYSPDLAPSDFFLCLDLKKNHSMYIVHMPARTP